MRDGLIISAIGKDRPGIVDSLTGMVLEHGGNLEDSRMAILGGEFSLMVLVTASTDSLRTLEATLPRVAEELDLTVQIRPTRIEESSDSEPALNYRLSVVSMDHPGIVHRVSKLLAQRGVNVAKLDTHLGFAPTTGTPVFSLSMEVQVPAQLPIAGLRGELETLAEEENLDLELRAQS
jgi:glycine cleavage system transcriptional repressor